MPLKSYGQWMLERTNAGLPVSVPPPAGVESYKDWYLRIRGLRLGEATRVLSSEIPKAIAQSDQIPKTPLGRRALASVRGIMTRTFG
jgi:hypothetical protein